MAIKAVFYFDGNDVVIHQDEAKEVRQDFRPGLYRAFFRKEQINVIEIILKEKFNPHYSPDTSTILKYVSKFTSAPIKKEVNNMGFLHKIGIFMFGTHGVGKSSIINYLCDELIKKQNAIVLIVEDKYQIEAAIQLTSMIRDIQDNLIVIVFDEIDEYAIEYEGTLKSFLDGQNSVDNSIFLAATNYLSKVPDTLLRPSRFKVVVEIKGVEDYRVIKDIVKPLIDKSNLKMTKKELEDFCVNLKGSTLDEIKTAVLDKIMNLRLKITNTSIGFSKKETSLEGEYEKFKAYFERFNKEFDEELEEDGWEYNKIDIDKEDLQEIIRIVNK